MMTLSTAAAASPDQTAAARANAARAADVAASARRSVREADTAGAANDAKMAATAAAKASSPAPVVPDPMNGVTTLGIAGSAQNSLPATLAQLNHLALVGASGQLSEADRATLQSEYAQLTQQVAGVVGVDSVTAQQAAFDQRQESDADTNSQDSDDRRSTLTRNDQQAPMTVESVPTEQLVRTVKSVPVAVQSGPRITPKVSLQTHELHVGTDSYEPVQVRMTRTQLSRPEASMSFVEQATTHRIMVAQVTQIAQMSQVAQVTHVNVVV